MQTTAAKIMRTVFSIVVLSPKLGNNDQNEQFEKKIGFLEKGTTFEKKILMIFHSEDDIDIMYSFTI